MLEALAFDIFDFSQGLLKRTAHPPEGRRVWAGIDFEEDGDASEVYPPQIINGQP